MKFSNGIYLTVFTLVLSACGGGSDSKTTSTATTTAAPMAKSSVDPATAATITGMVNFTGTKPTMKKISMNADAFCKGAHTETVLSEEVTVDQNGGLMNVLVYIKSGLEGSFPAPSDAGVLNQIGCLYVPHMLVVQANQDITIRNSDSVLHNVNAKPKNNKGFNIGQPIKGMESQKKFENSEIGIPFKCDVHPWMKSFVHVLNNPYHGVTGADGKFSLANLPPGTYELEAWHETLGTSVQKITIGASETKTVTFTFKSI